MRHARHVCHHKGQVLHAQGSERSLGMGLAVELAKVVHGFLGAVLYRSFGTHEKVRHVCIFYVYIGTVILYVLVERNVGVNVVLGLKLSSVVVDSASILQGRVHFLKTVSTVVSPHKIF